MNWLATFWKACLRKRHAKGFGIHSPYAFRFVNDVINPGRYGYYAYKEIDFNEAIEAKSSAKAKWLIRIMIFLKTRRVILLGPGTDNLKKEPKILQAIKTACQALKIDLLETSSHNIIDFREGDLMIIPNGDNNPRMVNEAICHFVAILAFNSEGELHSKLISRIPNGLLLSAPDKLLLIPRREMEYTKYEIDF